MPDPDGFSTAVRHAYRVIKEPEEFGDIVSGMSLQVEFQRRQDRPTVVEQFQTPDWALDFGEAHVKTCLRGVLPGGWASLCFMRNRAPSTFHGQMIEPGSLCCTPPGEELAGRTAPGFAWMTVALPPEAWARCRAIAGIGDRELHRFTACALAPSLSARIESQVRATHRQLCASSSGPQNAAVVQRDAAGLAMHLATMVCEISGKVPPPRDSLRNRTRLARRAEAWMQAHLTESIRVPDLCLALGVSRRELEYAFRSTFDQSPRDFLHNLRLHAIRRALLRADPRASILHVVLDHGITHPSRFAADYRGLFGERPSETMHVTARRR